MHRCTGAGRNGDGDADWQDQIGSCPVFHPSKEEFTDPLAYIRSIAPEASKYGICKVVSPLVASVSAGTVLSKERSNFKFTTRVQPMRLANWDSKDDVTFLISGRPYSFHDFEKMANKAALRKYQTTGNLPSKFVESEFWREMTSGKNHSVEYACDIEGSAFSSSSADALGTSRWNLKVLPYSSQSVLRLLQNAIPGVTDPMLYIGMLFSMFAWHVEDHYLYSINYLHCGAPKTWYGVPGGAAPDFERVARDNVYDPAMLAEKGDGAAYDLLIGKTTLFSPKLLWDNQIPVFRAVQGPGEFVITFPRAYHAGFSHGFNCGEAVNFAMLDWLPFGAAACRRYVLLNRLPLLPHEELLCREAMHYFERRAVVPECVDGVISAGDEHQKCLKVSFVRLMRFQHKIRWFLKQHTARSVVCPDFEGSELCSLCKHLCYVAYITCPCVQLPFCLNHANEIRECQCGTKRLIKVKDGLCEMEQAARQFEKEEGILEELCREPDIIDVTTISGTILEESMFHSDDYKAYIWDSDMKEDPSPCYEVQGGDASKAPVKRYSSVSVIVKKNSGNLQSFCRATRALGSLNCVPHFGTPVQVVPVEVLSPSEADAINSGPAPETGSREPGDHREFDEKSKRKCACIKGLNVTCQCQSGEVVTLSVKRKRSGLSVRQVRAGADEHLKKDPSSELRSFPHGTAGALPTDEDDEEEDGAHTVKRQRMASLDKIRSDGDPSSVTMPQYVPTASPVRLMKSERVGRQSKKGPIRLWTTPEGDVVLLLADIIRELQIKRALLEVVSLWQSKARKMLAELQFVYIHPVHLPSSKRHPALTLKACLCVKSFLSLQDSLKLQNLIQETFGKEESLAGEAKLSPKESSNDLSALPLQKRDESNIPDKQIGKLADNLVTVQIHSAPENLASVPKLKRKQGRLKSIHRNFQPNGKLLKGFRRVEPSVTLYGGKANTKQIRRLSSPKTGCTKQPDLSQRSICLNEFSATSSGERLRKKKLAPDLAVEDRCNASVKRLKTVMKCDIGNPCPPNDSRTCNQDLSEGVGIKQKDIMKIGRIKVKGPSLQVPVSSSDGTVQNSNTCCLKKSTISSLEGVDEGSSGSVVCKVQSHLPDPSAPSPEVVVKRKRGRPRKNRPPEEVPTVASSRNEIEPGEEKPKSRFLEEIVPRIQDSCKAFVQKNDSSSQDPSLLNYDCARPLAPATDLGIRGISSTGSDAASVLEVQGTAPEQKGVAGKAEDPQELKESRNSSGIVEVTVAHVERDGREVLEAGRGSSQIAGVQTAWVSPDATDGQREHQTSSSPSLCNDPKSDGLVEVPVKEHCGDRSSRGDSVLDKRKAENSSECSHGVDGQGRVEGTLESQGKRQDDAESEEKLKFSSCKESGGQVITAHCEDVQDEHGSPSTASHSGKQEHQSHSCNTLNCPSSDKQGVADQIPKSMAGDGNAERKASDSMSVEDAEGPPLCTDVSLAEASMDSILRGMPLLTESLDFPSSELFSGELAQLPWRGPGRNAACHIDELTDTWKGGRDQLPGHASGVGSLQSVPVFNYSYPGMQSSRDGQNMEGDYGQWQKLNSEVTNELLSAASHYTKVSSSTQNSVRGCSPSVVFPGPPFSGVRRPPETVGYSNPLQQSMNAMWTPGSGPQNRELVRDCRLNTRESYESNGIERMQNRSGCWQGNTFDGQSVYAAQSQMHSQIHGAQAGHSVGPVYGDRSGFGMSYVQQQQTALLSGCWGNVGGLEGHLLAARLESQQARLGLPWTSNSGNGQNGFSGSSRVGPAQAIPCGAGVNRGNPRVQVGLPENSQIAQWPMVPAFSGNPPSMCGLPPLPSGMGQHAPSQYHAPMQQAGADMGRVPVVPQSFQIPGCPGPPAGISQFPRGPGVQSASMHRYEETAITNQVARQSEASWQMGNQKFIEVTHRFVL